MLKTSFVVSDIYKYNNNFLLYLCPLIIKLNSSVFILYV